MAIGAEGLANTDIGSKHGPLGRHDFPLQMSVPFQVGI
jgi:hypothetical protein